MKSETQILSIVVTIAVAVVVSSLILLTLGVKAFLLVALLIPCLFLSYKFPRWGILAFLTYLPFAGTLAYSVAGIFKAVGGQITYTAEYPLFHLAKDAFYLPALLAILLTSQAFQKLQPKINPLLWALAILVGVSCLTLLFVNLPQQLTAQDEKPFLMGLVGLKVLLGYIPLILCADYFIRTRQDLFFLIRWLVVLILICCSLCFIQYFLLVKGICAGSSGLPEPASFQASLQARCFVGGSLLYNPARGLIRLPGTFVSPWQWGWFLISSSFITYLASVSEPSRRWRFVGGIGMAVVLGTAVISGQRIAFLLVPASFLLLLLLTQKDKKWLSFKLGLLALFSLLVVSHLDVVQQQIVSFINRWQYSPPQTFMAEQLQWVFQGRLEWLGHGLGRASSAARRLGEIRLIETFHAKLIYEIGVLGTLAFLGVVSVLTLLTFKAYRSLQERALRYLGICLWVFVLLISYNPYYYPLAVDPVAVYYWFFAGILLKLPELEQESGVKL